ncbi:MAG: 1-deoxy-D-xylulose-5-phosphate synthase [Desulfovibrionaceae bacterium]|nr:1-deoxy-D-xylulose-5-phosphate synthase [Desulfovibrionaceae bacterium]
MDTLTAYLQNLDLPGAIHDLTNAEMERLAAGVRERIVQVCAANGGHLAPSMGTVELTLALLASLDLSKDKVIWDVGHQSYAWKILTGRADEFHTLRRKGGLAGFPRRAESPYDVFGVGHASTSISAALGFADARDLNGENHHVVAVIGDGALTGGEAFEGLNLAGHQGRRMIIVLNDNEMSIAPNVGAMSCFLSRTLTRRWFRQTRKDALAFLRTIPRIGGKLALYAERGEWSFKSFFTPGMLFEAFRIAYIGPVDGHDIPALRQHLERAMAVEDGPVLLHVRTQKGHGYKAAEQDPTHYHGVGHFVPETGRFIPSGSTVPSFTKVFSKALVNLGRRDKKVVAITAAMPDGTGTTDFQTAFPDRFFDVGICEQHAVTFAAGLACEGYKPFTCLYSTFLQRGYDQVVHDVCLQNLPVVFCIDRAGLVGEDGGTHQGVFDIAYLRHIPNMHLLAPRDDNMLARCVETAADLGAPVAFRYPRGGAFGVPVDENPAPLPIARGEQLREGRDIAVLAAGPCAHLACLAAEKAEKRTGCSVLVFDPVWLKPLPEEQMLAILRSFKYVLTVEEGIRAGGFGSAVLELAADNDLLDGLHITRLGVPDEFIEHARQSEQRADLGLDTDGIEAALEKLASQAGFALLAPEQSEGEAVVEEAVDAAVADENAAPETAQEAAPAVGNAAAGAGQPGADGTSAETGQSGRGDKIS